MERWMWKREPSHSLTAMTKGRAVVHRMDVRVVPVAESNVITLLLGQQLEEKPRRPPSSIADKRELLADFACPRFNSSSATPAAPAASTTTAADAFSTPAPAPRAPAAPSAPVKGLGSEAQMAQLADILANIQGGASGAGSDVPCTCDAVKIPFFEADRPLCAAYLLPDVLPSSDLLNLIASTPSLLPTLLPFLPSDIPPTEESVRRAITSPEFKRATSSLDRALRTGALGPLVAGLGLPESGAHGVENFLEAIEKQAEELEEKEEAEGKKDGEGKMETD